MCANRPGPTCRPRFYAVEVVALVIAFVAGAGMARAQQAGALAVSVTVARSATIEIAAADLRGANPTAGAAAAVTVRYGAAIRLPGQTSSALPAPSAKATAPVVSPSANGRTLSIQF